MQRDFPSPMRRWSDGDLDARQEVDNILLVITGTCALWWAVSFILAPLWLAVRPATLGGKDEAADHWGGP